MESDIWVVHMESVSNVACILFPWVVTMHILAGIFQMILSCPENILAPHFEKIVNCIEWLIGLQDDNGNWPNKAGHPTTTNSELVQCVGSVLNTARNTVDAL